VQNRREASKTDFSFQSSAMLLLYMKPFRIGQHDSAATLRVLDVLPLCLDFCLDLDRRVEHAVAMLVERTSMVTLSIPLIICAPNTR
jgi:hypothetical protein